MSCRSAVRVLVAGVATTMAACEGLTGSAGLKVPPPAVAAVSVALYSPSLTAGQSTQATASLTDAAGHPLNGRTITWSSSNVAVATVSNSGAVTALSAGSASISATSEGVTGSATLAVSSPATPVATVLVTLESAAVTVGQRIQAPAVLRDAAGIALTGRSISWASSNPAVAIISSTGAVTGTGYGNTTIQARSEGVTGSVPLSVAGVASSGEPIFTSGTNRELFYDGFETFMSSSDLLAYQSHFPGRWARDISATGDIVLQTSSAAVGSNAVRFIYPARSNQQNLLLEAIQAQKSNASVVVVTFWMRTQPGYVWNSGVGQGGQGHKLFVGNISGASHTPNNRILLQQDVVGILPGSLASCYSSFEFISSPTWSIGNVLLKQNMNLATWRINVQGNNGTWQRWTTRFTQSTDPITDSGGHGRVEMWVDGVQVMKYLGDDPSRCEYGFVNVPHAALGELFPNLHFPSVNGAVGGQWLEFDDIRIWTP